MKLVFVNKKAIKHGQVIKENAHRYKQDVEKSYVLQLLIQQEKQVKETKNEKVQEVH